MSSGQHIITSNEKRTQIWKSKESYSTSLEGEGEGRNDIITLCSQKLKKNTEDSLTIKAKGSLFFLEFPALHL